MRNNRWIKLAVLLVSSLLVLTVSCQKKTVAVQKASVSTATEKAYVGEKDTDSSAEIRESESVKMDGVVMQQDIYFDFDKSTLTHASRETLIKNGEWLRANSDVIITIEGHCDERGTNAYNLALGDKRAESVKTFLLDLGIDTPRLNTITYGEERPADPRHNEGAWTKNRRAHFLIK